MIIAKTIEIDMGHRVPAHKSKCNNIHGHRYKIEVGVDDKVITTAGASDEGMVIDYGDLKQIMMEEIHEKFDHGFVMYTGDKWQPIFEKIRDSDNMKIIFVSFIPTAENLAKHWYKKLKVLLDDIHIKIKFVKVWETPNLTAVYEE